MLHGLIKLILIQEDLSALGREGIKVPLGTLVGSRFFSGMGPDITLQIVPTGNLETVFKSEFEAVGVNQTIHRLYLMVSCEVSILTSYNVINTKIDNQILFAENMIIGEVPNTYYNLELFARI